MINNIRKLVRPFIGIVLTSVIAYLGITGKLKPIEVVALYGPIVGFYFGERSAAKKIE